MFSLQNNTNSLKTTVALYFLESIINKSFMMITFGLRVGFLLIVVWGAVLFTLIVYLRIYLFSTFVPNKFISILSEENHSKII